VQPALIFPNLTGRGQRGKGGRRSGRRMEILSEFISREESSGGAEGEGKTRNDRGITNGARRKKGAKKGGTACQRNNAADAKANKMPSGVAPINHCVRTYHLPFGPRRGVPRRAAPMHSINKTCGAKRSARCIDWLYQINVT